MKTLTPIQIRKEIARRNAIFKGKNNAQKRVLIAKDVLKQIQKKTIIPERGAFIRSDNLDSGVYKQNESLRNIFLNNKCDCCALGAMVVSCTLFNNREKVSDYTERIENLGESLANNRIFKNKFTDIFSKEQLVLIEIAFEQGAGYFRRQFHSNLISESDFLRGKYFGLGYKTPRNRLIGIMNNIINNKGTFNPPVVDLPSNEIC